MKHLIRYAGAATLLFCLQACSPPTVPTQGSGSGLGRFRLMNTAPKGQLTRSNGNIYLANVPFVKQGQDNTCGQAVATMILKFWGHDIDYQTVVNESNPLNLGTRFDALQSYLRSKGLHAQSYKGGSLELLVALINRGRPVIALLDFGGLAREHYVLVVGYNAERNTLIMHESNSAPYVELEAAEFVARWQNPSLVNLPLLGGPSYQGLMFDVGTEAAVAEENGASASG